MSRMLRFGYGGALMRATVRDYKGPFLFPIGPQQKCCRTVLSSAMSTVAASVNAKTAKCANLTNRSLIKISGKDSGVLLQGLLTNDINLLEEEKAIYTMMLNHQGRVLYDAILYKTVPEGKSEPDYILECEETVQSEIQKHIKMHKIRKKADIVNISSEYDVWAVFDANSNTPNSDKNVIYVPDPRVPSFASRIIVPKDTAVAGTIPESTVVSLDEYSTHRYIHGISEGTHDLPPGNSLPLEANLDYMNGVNFHKGCYLGQELTARTYHTGVIRKRLMPITLVNYKDDSVIKAGETVSSPSGKNAGKFRSHIGIHGIALLRMVHTKDTLKVNTESGGEVEVKARVPEWWPHQSVGDVAKLHCA